MKFGLIEVIMNPLFLMFIAVITGVLFGKIKFGKFNFGISGTLFTGLFFGWLAYTVGQSVLAEGESASGYNQAVSTMANGVISTDFFYFFLIIFVAAVGLLAAKDLKAILKKYGARFVILGILVTFTGGAMTYAMTLVSTGEGKDSSSFEVSGVYTGALTSSPGLAAALESATDAASHIGKEYSTASTVKKQEILDIVSPGEDIDASSVTELSSEQIEAYVTYAQGGVGIGHAVAYPFGVLMIILALNILPRAFRMDMEKEWERYNLEMAEARESAGGREIPEVPFSTMTFFLTCLIGFLFGKIHIYLGPIGYFTLGSTGGTLVMALILGYIGKIGPVNFRMDAKILAALKEIGLAFFLAIVGLRYGGMVVEALVTSGLQLVIVTLIVSISALAMGFILGRGIFKLNWILLSGAMAGGMTSTPGLGAAVDALKSDEPAAGYGAVYPFALMTKVILVIILHKLPMG